MLNITPKTQASLTWQEQLMQGFKQAKDLLTYLGIPLEHYHHQAEAQFKTIVPKSFASKMLKGDVNCPLLKQVLPLKEELVLEKGYHFDPLGEKQSNPVKGVLHKYHGRVLVTLTTTCAVHCRYCFRRHFPYEENRLSTKDWGHVLNYLQSHPEVHEVIVSGGDPLLIPNANLVKFVDEISTLKQIETLRVHTRLPVVLPVRLDQGLIDMFSKLKLNKVVVLHINHPNELCDEIKSGVERLRQANVMVFNQAVLLKGINDDSAVLETLCRRLFDSGILPYYLHFLDKVHGAKHFEVEKQYALFLHKSIQDKLPGYLVPKLVEEVAGAKSKLALIR